MNYLPDVSLSEDLGQSVSTALATELRRIVDDQRISLTTLSAASGIPRSTLHARLAGRGRLTVAQLVRLAVALDVPAAELVTAAMTARGVTVAGEQSEVDAGTQH